MAALSRFPPDVVVLDLRMPGMDGRTVFEELRRRGVMAPVLILSAYGAEEARKQLGAEAFLGKPVEPASLVEAIRRTLTAHGG